MDLSKPFDAIDHTILLCKLKSYGVRGTAFLWFEDYLSGKQQFVSFQSNNSKKSFIKCGVPQGSILGPLLFLVYVNDIINSAPLLNYTLFADDTQIFCSNKNLDSLVETLNNELVKVSQWFKSNKLSLNIDKTNFMYFRINHANNAQCNIDIDGIPITEKKSTNHFGINIKLEWTYSKHSLLNFP